MPQEELIGLYDRYIQSCKKQYGAVELSKGIRAARTAQFAHALTVKAQQLLLYAKGTKGIDINLFTAKLRWMANEAISTLDLE